MGDQMKKRIPKVHLVFDGTMSLCGKAKRDVSHITSLDGWHTRPEGKGYEDTCKRCLIIAKAEGRRGS